MVERYLVPLLLKLGVMASIASILARSSPFKSMLMRENRTLNQRLTLSLWLSVVFGASVATRVVCRSYQAADLGLEGSLLAGILGGYVTGLLSGIADFAARHVRRRASDHAAAGRRRRLGRPAARPGARSGRDLALLALLRPEYLPLLQGE